MLISLQLPLVCCEDETRTSNHTFSRKQPEIWITPRMEAGKTALLFMGLMSRGTGEEAPGSNSADPGLHPSAIVEYLCDPGPGITPSEPQFCSL